MTLTQSGNTDWADSDTAKPQNDGLTGFGRAIVGRMNPLGMIVNLSHVSAKPMKDATAASQSPVMLTHSGACTQIDHPHDFAEDALRLEAQNHGIVMVNFYTDYISQARGCWMSIMRLRLPDTIRRPMWIFTSISMNERLARWRNGGVCMRRQR